METLLFGRKRFGQIEPGKGMRGERTKEGRNAYPVHEGAIRRLHGNIGWFLLPRVQSRLLGRSTEVGCLATCSGGLIRHRRCYGGLGSRGCGDDKLVSILEA